MGKSNETIVSEIISHIQNCAGEYFSDYYVGIAEDPEERLFDEHQVDRKTSCWIFREALNINHARTAEKSLIAKGMKGGDGGGSNQSIYVYCYQITQNTQE